MTPPIVRRLRRASLIAADASTLIEVADALATAADKIEDFTDAEAAAIFERVRAHLYEAESDDLLRDFDAVLTKSGIDITPPSEPTEK